MSALSQATQRRTKPIMSWVQNYVVLNSGVLYVGSFAGMLNGTSTAQRGYAKAYADQNSIKYLGLVIGSPFSLSTTLTVTGNTSGTPVPQVTVEAGPFIMQSYTVTGSSAFTDVGRQVYLRNDNDMNVTQILSPRIGRIEYWYTSTTCDVLVYGNLASEVI
jgi:hypothetical protein